MTIQDKETEFVVFCIENTAAKLGITGTELYCHLEQIGGIKSFLYPSYQALHTQSKDYIVDETINYIKEKSPDFLKTKGVTA
ncbi:MAG: DUF3791 domain-containing protein [Bacteroidaceae bacterium]|nr:DUF3791 domain-containing protein [Bacteroidaceae bacterium]